MIDRDGIERPDDPHAHEFSMPQKQKPIKITEKTYLPKNPFYIAWCYIVRAFAWLTFPIMFRLIYGVKVHGKEKLKQIKGSSAVIVSNHVHNMDFPCFAACAIPSRKIRFLAMQSNFQIPFIGKILSTFGGVPIPDEMKDYRCFVSSVNKIIDKGQPIHIMAEGSLWRYYRDLRPFLPGSFKFAVSKDIPVVPVVFSFRMKTKTKKNGKIKRKYKMDITILDSLKANPDLPKNEKINELCERTHFIMNECLTKINEENDKKYKKTSKN